MHVYREIGGGAIFLLAIAAVITRSRRINEATAAAVGAAAILGFGVLSPAQALATLVVGASVDRREPTGAALGRSHSAFRARPQLVPGIADPWTTGRLAPTHRRPFEPSAPGLSRSRGNLFVSATT